MYFALNCWWNGRSENDMIRKGIEGSERMNSERIESVDLVTSLVSQSCPMQEASVDTWCVHANEVRFVNSRSVI